MGNNFIKKGIITVVSIAFVFLFFNRDKLDCFLVKTQLQYSNVVYSKIDSIQFFDQFKNKDGNKKFQVSLLEIGGVGCKPCRKMDTVLVQLKDVYKENLNIHVSRVTDKDGKKIAKYLGVKAIPTQIIMNKKGEEIYRHTGFLSKTDLQKIINKTLLN